MFKILLNEDCYDEMKIHIEKENEIIVFEYKNSSGSIECLTYNIKDFLSAVEAACVLAGY